ncbi:MAG: CheR family methyltransferase [Actinomycetota bacterium]
MTRAFDPTPFKELIRVRCGLMLEGGDEPLVLAVHKRMAATGAANPSMYFARLVGQEDEFQEFVTLLTINETYFYRQPEQLALLVERIMPQLLADDGGRLPIRILSAGCSTGEEPYSIAIAMLEKFGEGAARLVQIVGGDIDHHALAKARAGRYGAFSFRGMPQALRERYFHPAGRDGMVVDDRVKAMVSFQRLNLLAEGFGPEFDDLDVVFFRNVSIYFDEATRRAIQHSFRRAMTPRGRLVIGSAETLANDLGVFRMVEDGGQFYFIKDAEAPARPKPVLAWEAPAVVPVFEAPPPPPPPPVPAPAAFDLDEVRALVRDKRWDRAQAALAVRNAAAPADAGLLALEGYVRLMGRDFPGAAELAGRARAADEWSVDALVVLGLAAKWQDRADEAVKALKQAVYLRHDCWPAHYYLGDLYRAQGAAELARRSYRVALQLLTARPDPDGGLVLPLGLPVAEVRFLCERHAGAAVAATARR